MTMDNNRQALHTGAAQHADAVHPRAVGGARGGATHGALHHRVRLPAPDGRPHQGLGDQHQPNQTSLCATRQVQAAR